MFVAVIKTGTFTSCKLFLRILSECAHSTYISCETLLIHTNPFVIISRRYLETRLHDICETAILTVVTVKVTFFWSVLCCSIEEEPAVFIIRLCHPSALNMQGMFFRIFGRPVYITKSTASHPGRQYFPQHLFRFNLQAPYVLYIGQAFRYSLDNAFYIFNQQIYFII